MAAVTARRAPYKDFLQPALHRRFSSTATILLIVAYVYALFLGNWRSSWIWPWFPVGIAGIRTFFIFLCGLSIIVLRIAQYHVGIRTSNSAIQTFARHAFKVQTFETLFSYLISAWLFSQIYLWHNGESRHLEWISYFSGDRVRLNERPLFLTMYLMFFAVVQAARHLFRDNDYLAPGIVWRKSEGVAREKGNSNGDPLNHLKKLSDMVPSVFIESWAQAVVVLLASMPLYALLVRGAIWPYVMAWFRLFYKLPSSNIPPITLPFQWSILLRCAWSGGLLAFLWMMGNQAFSVFLVKEPLKNGKPLTSESKDPNGSLLNGLKSKKPAIKAFAMWELAFIARDYQDRRKVIFQDIERRDGPMWSQVYGICLDLVRDLETRVDAYGKPPAPPPTPQAAAETKLTEGLRLHTQPLRGDAIMVSTPERKTFRSTIQKAVSHAVIDRNQPSRLSPLAQKAMAEASGAFSAAQREFGGAENPDSSFQQLARRFLRWPIGWPFRQEFRRRLQMAVLGTPYGGNSVYINAINSVSQLAVHSLTEDNYGNVQRDVSTIIRTFTSTTRKLDSFITGFPMHWADIERRRATPPVDDIVKALREGLTDLIHHFGKFSRDLKLSQTDLRLAREAAGIANDEEGMVQIGRRGGGRNGELAA